MTIKDYLSRMAVAENFLDEILVLTMIDKHWDYRRIALYAIDKQIETLKRLETRTQSLFVAEALNELISQRLEIQKMP